MALKLNSYRTVTEVVPTTPLEVYTCPIGYNSVILLCQVANISSTNAYDFTMLHRRNSTDTEICKSFPISSNDSVSLLEGKLILESGDSLVISGSNSSNLKFIVSVLETLE